MALWNQIKMLDKVIEDLLKIQNNERISLEV